MGEAKIGAVGHGSPGCDLGALQDLRAELERREAVEAELRRSRRRLIDAQRVARIGSWEWEVETGVLHWTEETYRIFGRSPADFAATYENFLLTIHPEDRAGVEVAVQRALDEGVPYSIDHRVIRPDGTERLVHEAGALSSDYDGRRVFIGTVQDVTESRRSEEELALLAQVFANAQEAIVITDGSGAIVRTNTAFTLITGYGTDEVIGRNPRILKSNHHPPEFYRQMWAAIAEVGLWTGEIWNRRKDGRVYPSWQSISAVRDPHGRITHYVAVAIDISDRKRVEERLEHLATHDALTGLPNRLLLMDRLERSIALAVRQGESFAVLFVDLDRFKVVNDNWGHSVGDRVLVTAAERLSRTVRAVDTVARFGGDEFVVLLERTDSAGAVQLANRLIEALGAPVPVGEERHALGASVGIALFPEHGSGPAELLRNADVAMYRAKASRKVCVTYGPDGSAT